MPTTNVSNYTTLYSATAGAVSPQQPYGNANVEAFLNIGTDGGNTVQNIVANGAITANGNIESNGYFVGDGGYLSNVTANTSTSANFANYAGNVTNSAQPNITTVGTLINLDVSGNITVNGNITANGNVNALNYVVTNKNSVFAGPNAKNNYDSVGLPNDSIRIGNNSTPTTIENFTIAIGTIAQQSNAQPHAIAIGASAGTQNQGAYSVALGDQAGAVNLGSNSIAIGTLAGDFFQGNNSIILNATGSALNQTTANTFTVKPIRNATDSNVLFYNNTTGEITYDVVGNVVANNANFANYAGNVTNSAQPNITTVGNLTSLTVNDGVANASTLQFYPNANVVINTPVFGPLPYSSSKNFTAYGSESVTQTKDNTGFSFYTNDYFVSDGLGNTALTSFFSVDAYGSPPVATDAFNPAQVTFQTASPYTNLANPATQTLTNFNFGSFSVPGFALTVGGDRGTASLMNFQGYNNTGNSVAFVITRNRGDADSPLTVQPDDYVGDIAWRPRRPGGPTRNMRIGAKVDSSYVAGTADIPIGFEITVCNTTANITHSFYSNGSVFLASNLTANGNLAVNNANLGNLATANYFTGTLTTNAQPNITSVGNLISLNINSGVANTNIIQFSPNGIPYQTGNYPLSYGVYNTVWTGYDSANGGASHAYIKNEYNGYESFVNDYFVNDNTGTAYGGFYSFDTIDVIGNASTDPLVPSTLNWAVYDYNSNLANVSTQTLTQFTISPSVNLLKGSEQSNVRYGLFNAEGYYGSNSQATAIFLQSRRGNGDVKTAVQANDKFADIAFMPKFSGTGSGSRPAGNRFPRFGPQVDAGYTGANNAIPAGLYFQVNDTTANYTHNMYANGNVSFNNNVSAVSFSGDGGNLSNINVSNITGNANFANFAGNVTNSAQPNITSVGTLVSLDMGGNITANANITYDIGNSTNRFKDIWLANSTIYLGNANLKSDDTNNTFNVSVTGTANAFVVGNTKTTLTGSNIAFVASNTTNSATNYFIPSGGVVNAISTSNIANTITVVHTQTGAVSGASDTIGYLRSNGNLSTPSAAANNSTAGRTVHMVYNGNTYVEFARVTPAATQAANASFTSASTVMTPGVYNIRVGSQFGNSTGFDNTTFNVMQFSQNGRLDLYSNSASSSANFSNMGGILNYIYSNNASDRPNWYTGRHRGTGQTPQAVQASDDLFQFNIYGNSGNGVQNGAQIKAVVSSNAVISNGNRISTDLTLTTYGGTLTLDTANLAGGYGTGRGDICLGSGSNLANVFAGNIYVGDSQGNTKATLYSNGSMQFGAGNSYIYPNGAISLSSSNIQLKTDGEGVFGAGNIVLFANGLVNANQFSTANTNIYANGAVNTNGELTADNVKIDTNGFMKLSTYTAAGLTAITGQVGWIAAVTDSAGGGNPNGMIAFWDTTNTRWSYVHDNSAV